MGERLRRRGEGVHCSDRACSMFIGHCLSGRDRLISWWRCPSSINLIFKFQTIYGIKPWLICAISNCIWIPLLVQYQDRESRCLLLFHTSSLLKLKKCSQCPFFSSDQSEIYFITLQLCILLLGIQNLQ